jgi:3'-phosphoadenosine 5'-phosphosulfate sulfotransferase (PAPS reductase)/FAD synthetase
MVLSWQGVRAQESLARRHLLECDEVGGGLFNYRPILRWTVEDVFEAHRVMGIKPNPLYSMGMGRVGCMPCIHARKDELLEISRRFPEEIERVAQWERAVAEASKRGAATFFATVQDDPVAKDGPVSAETHGIHRFVEWSKTSRGGRQYDLLRMLDGPACSSIYGLCE